MSTFHKGQLVVPDNKRYYPLMKGQLLITEVLDFEDVPLYKCTDTVGTEYEFWEYELETQYQQDKRVGLLNK